MNSKRRVEGGGGPTNKPSLAKATTDRLPVWALQPDCRSPTRRTRVKAVGVLTLHSGSHAWVGLLYKAYVGMEARE